MEANKRICKICGVEKHRILIGKFNVKDKKYVDDTGKTWNGSKCPACHIEEVRRRMQAMRVLKKGMISE